jgi:hypothetical protein
MATIYLQENDAFVLKKIKEPPRNIFCLEVFVDAGATCLVKWEFYADADNIPKLKDLVKACKWVKQQKNPLPLWIAPTLEKYSDGETDNLTTKGYLLEGFPEGIHFSNESILDRFNVYFYDSYGSKYEVEVLDVKMYDLVTVEEDFLDKGIKKGDDGTVVEILTNKEGTSVGYEVEVFDTEGQTIDVITLQRNQFKLRV